MKSIAMMTQSEAASGGGCGKEMKGDACEED